MSFTDYKSFVNFVSKTIKRSDQNNITEVIEDPIKQEVIVQVRGKRKKWHFSYSDRIDMVAKKAELARYELSQINLDEIK